MRVVAFTGTTDVWDEAQFAHIYGVCEQIPDPETIKGFRFGGAWGVDTATLVACATLYPYVEATLVYPEGEVWNDGLRYHPYVDVVVPVAGGYMARNDVLVAEPATELVAIPKTSREENRSGTWSTVRRARKRGIPVSIQPLRKE